METFQKPVTFMYFWLNYLNKNHIERISVAVKDIDHLFNMTSEIIEADNLYLILLSVGTRIDDNGCLESLENGTELIVCREEKMQKLLIYFEIKRYLSLKNISYPLDIEYFLWHLASFRVAAFFKITLMFIEAVMSTTSLVLFKVYFNSFYI